MPQQHTAIRFGLCTLFFLALCAGWDLLGLDLALARRFGGPTGFALRDHWLWSNVLHVGARRVSWALELALVLMVWWPLGPLRQLTRRQRVFVVIATGLSVVAVSLVKGASLTSCPWDLSEFGGNARYVSHWTWGVGDGGEGHCFPAGHASAAFCFFPGYFWLRDKTPTAANIWLAVTVLAGALLGLAQQVRGAHYLSHTLWTAWLCWAVAGLSYVVLEHGPLRRRFSPS